MRAVYLRWEVGMAVSGWVHEAKRGEVCYEAVQTGETPTPCGCTTPTPDR